MLRKQNPTTSTLPSPACGRGAGGEGASLLERAKSLRTLQTDAELRLWFHLRAHRFMGKKFKRQKPVGHYIVDFICFDPKLIVEIDGGQHAEQVEYDRRRDAYLVFGRKPHFSNENRPLFRYEDFLKSAISSEFVGI